MDTVENIIDADESSKNGTLPILHEELVVKILENLEANYLKEHLLIKDHRKLIMTNSDMMRKLPLILQNRSWKEKMPFIKKYGSLVKEIRFNECSFDAISDPGSILTMCENVETVAFHNCYIRTPDPEDAAPRVEVTVNEPGGANDENPEEGNPPELSELAATNTATIQKSNDEIGEYPKVELGPLKLAKLKSLCLDAPGTAQEIIKYFANVDYLEFLRLTFYYQDPKQNFTDFFVNQKKLKNLELAGWSDLIFKSLFATNIVDQIKFKLDRFSIECELTNNQNFTTFFRGQKQMKEFILGGHNINFNFYRIIFNELKQLRKLTMPIDWFLTDERMNEIMNCRIESLRDLYIVGSNDDSIIFKTVIDIFPNLVKLRVENLTNFSATCCESLRSLKYFHVENYRGESLMFVKFAQLKSLEIDYLFPFGLDFVWNNFTSNNYGLEKLVVKEIGNFKLTESIKKEIGIIVSSLQNLPSLKYCKIVRTAQAPIVNADVGGHDPRQQVDLPYFKILADKRHNTLEVSQFIQQNCSTIDSLLQQIFVGYNVINSNN